MYWTIEVKKSSKNNKLLILKLFRVCSATIPAVLGCNNCNLICVDGVCSPAISILDPVTVQSVTEFQSYSLQLSLVQPGIGNTVWSLLNAPSGMTISSTGLVSWNSAIAVTNDYTITARAVNSYSSE